MKTYIMNNLPTIIILTALFIYIIYLAVSRKWAQLRALACKLILQAEKTITGTKVGQERFEMVFAKVYSLIPSWLQFFFPQTLVREKLQEWFNDIKDYLDNGKLDKSI